MSFVKTFTFRMSDAALPGWYGTGFDCRDVRPFGLP